jgi:tetratricopeptide (TPR) repeat protein
MSKLAPDQVRAGRRQRAILWVLAVLATGAGLAAAFWPSPDAEMLSRRAHDEFMERRFDLAEADLARVKQLRPLTSLDWMLEAQFLIMKGQTDEALKALALVPDESQMGAQARLQAGKLELRRNRFIPAEAYYLVAIRIDPKLVQARRELVYIYGMQLRHAEINANFRALSEISPLKYQELFLWCMSRGITWDAAEIVDTLKKCLEADPNDRWARLGMANGLRELRRYDEAEAVLTPLPDSDSAARATRVRIALDRGEDQLAESLLAGGPTEDVDLALLRGRFALARGEGAEAVRQYRISYEKAPGLREAVLGLGQALKSIGDPAAGPLLEEGRKHERLNTLVQKAASEKNRDDPALARDLGEACAALGRFHEAKGWYNLAITRDPFDIAAQDGLGRAKELEAKIASAASPR